MFGNHRPTSDGFGWLADDGPLLVLFGSSLPSQKQKNVVRVGQPLATRSGSAHVTTILFR